MSIAKQDLAGFIKANLNEMYKQHFVYDGSNRCTDIYTAQINAPSGAPCMRTRFNYVGAATVVDGVMEGEDVWNSAWEF